MGTRYRRTRNNKDMTEPVAHVLISSTNLSYAIGTLMRYLMHKGSAGRLIMIMAMGRNTRSSLLVLFLDREGEVSHSSQLGEFIPQR